QSFRRILLSNSHGGNITALNALVDEMGARRAEDLGAPALVAATYAVEAAEAFAPLLEDQDGVQHACEAETSMMLACAPDLVDAAILGEVGTPFPGRALGGGGAHRWRPFEHLTGDGALGVPARATAEKGEALLAAGAQSLAALLRDDAVWAAAGDRRGAATGGVPFADR
ncbi:MAG: creatininase family protein, partial [Pseudomonadota bacterium]